MTDLKVPLSVALDEIECLEARIAELEGEPTDAQVEAALLAFGFGKNDPRRPAMRAALKAARGVK